MSELDILQSISDINVTCTVRATLLANGLLLVGSKEGTLLIFQVANSKPIELIKSIPDFTIHPIDSIKYLKNAYFILSNKTVSVFDDATLTLQETLPFKPISCLKTYTCPTFGTTLLAISTKSMILVHLWSNDQLEMTRRYSLPDKVVTFEFISDDTLIAATNLDFYFIQTKNELHQVIPIPFNSPYSLFNKKLEILVLGKNTLLTKGTFAKVIDNSNLNSRNLNFAIDQSTILSKFLRPFLITIAPNNIKLINPQNGFLLQTIKLNKIISVDFESSNFIISTKNALHQFQISLPENLIMSLEHQNLQEAISLVNQFAKSQYPEKYLRLRDLEIKYGIRLFESGHYVQAMSKFSEFIAPVLLVIGLYPEYIAGKYSLQQSIREGHETNTRSIELLTQYLSDIRRKLNKLLKSDSKELDYNGSKLTVSMFTEDKTDIEELRCALDSTLFRCYTEVNVGLIGSLVRVENFCDPDLVVSTLKSQRLYNELVDFYYKRHMHEEALQLLLGIGEKSKIPDILVKYLQKLNNNNLDLLFKYSVWPISVNESFGIEIFINSQHSDELNRSKVLRYLSDKSSNLERIYLEFIVIELGDKSQYFNTKLAEIYLDLFSEAEYDPEAIYYKKLNTFLQIGAFDLKTILSKIPQDTEDLHLKLLRSLVLKRLGEHEEVLKIYVFQLQNPDLAINYITELLSSDLDLGGKFLVSLIELFWENNDKQSILSLLSSSQIGKIPIIEIFQKLPAQFKIYEIEQFLIKSLRLQQKFERFSNLTRNLRTVESVKIEETLLDLQNVKVNVIANNTTCDVCNSYLANSVLNRFPDGTLVHFGCSKLYQNILDEKRQRSRLKTIKLKDLYS